MRLETKDPGATLDFMIDWSDFLGADTIATSTWTVPSGVTQSGAAIVETKKAKVFLAGGTLGKKYVIKNTIISTGGRVGVQSFDLLIART